MAVIPVNATVTVTTHGTRAQVNGTAGILPTSIYFEALKTNTGNIYVGLSDVSATKYIACLPAGNSFSLTSDGIAQGRLSGMGLKLASFYVDSSVDGEKIQVTYMFNQGN